MTAYEGFKIKNPSDAERRKEKLQQDQKFAWNQTKEIRGTTLICPSLSLQHNVATRM